MQSVTIDQASKTMPIVRSVADLRAVVAGWRKAGLRVAVVPTMGALHDGHLSLMRLAKAKADRVIVTLFVNPTQFAPHEDFETYPRSEETDVALLQEAKCDLLYMPTAAVMYGQGFATQITVAGVSAPLDGLARPHFFGGVATVVAKLLIQIGPDIAIFGEKDYQQLQVIRRMVADLDLPVTILGATTARAKDGLALSSRNAYLTPAQRKVAGQLNVIMAKAAEAVAKGGAISDAEAQGYAALLAEGFDKIDYFEFRDAADLRRLGPGRADGEPRLFAAAWLGQTRLIDNRS
jgi:pantoate--beta-alanine ligase